MGDNWLETYRSNALQVSQNVFGLKDLGNTGDTQAAQFREARHDAAAVNLCILNRLELGHDLPRVVLEHMPAVLDIFCQFIDSVLDAVPKLVPRAQTAAGGENGSSDGGYQVC